MEGKYVCVSLSSLTSSIELVAIKKSLFSEEISKCEDSESIFCKVSIKGSKTLIIGSTYRPPNSCMETAYTIVREVSEIVTANPRAVFWLGGDFNLPDINWPDQETFDHQYPKPLNDLFLEMSQTLGLEQVVDIPTRGTNILDILFTNFPGFLKKCSLLSGLGDHEIVKIVSSIKPIRKKPIKRRIELWDRVDKNEIRKQTHNLKINSGVYILPDSQYRVWGSFSKWLKIPFPGLVFFFFPYSK